MQLELLGTRYIQGQRQFTPLEYLLLAYLSFEGKVHRSILADLFWAHIDSAKARSKMISEYLLRLHHKLPNALDLSKKPYVELHLDTDVATFIKAVESSDFETAIRLYKGCLLENLERNLRIKSDKEKKREELETWLGNTRERLNILAIKALLAGAKQKVHKEAWEQVRNFSLRAYTLLKETSFPAPDEFLLLYTLLLAADVPEAKEVKEEMLDYYDEELEGLSPCHTPQEALDLLSSVKGLRYLPFQLIGRYKELGQLQQLLLGEHSRLVTLVGLGGVGKTSLAQLLGSSLKKHFQQLYFVRLEDVGAETSHTDFLTKLIQGLGLSSNRLDPLETLAYHCNAAPTLIILDNFEQLTDHAPTLAELLARCETLKVLVTSRIALRLQGEKLVQLKGLQLAEDLTFESYQQDPESSSALILLKQLMSEQGVELSENNFDDALELCELTGGLPLGLKLISSWLASRSLGKLVALVKEGDALTAPDLADIAKRHQSLIGIFETSLLLLDKHEQKALASVSIFQAPFTEEAAKEVCGVEALSLNRLLNALFINFDRKTERYSFHPLVKQFASGLERDEGLEERHAAYFLGRLELVSFQGQARSEIVKALTPELSDIVTAWRYMVSQNSISKLQGNVKNLRSLMDQSNNLQLGLDLLQLYEKDNPNPFTLIHKTWLQMRLNDPHCKENAIKALRMSNDKDVQNTALTILGAKAEEEGEYHQALSYFEKIFASFPEQNLYTATAQTNMAFMNLKLGMFTESMQNLNCAKRIFTSLKREDLIVWTLYIQALLHETSKEYKKAITIAHKALFEAANLNLSYRSALLHRVLAESYLEIKNVERAQTHLELFKEKASGWLKGKYFHILAKIDHLKNDSTSAEIHYKEAFISMINAHDTGGLLHILVDFIAKFPEHTNFAVLYTYIKKRENYYRLNVRYKATFDDINVEDNFKHCGEPFSGSPQELTFQLFNL